MIECGKHTCNQSKCKESFDIMMKILISEDFNCYYEKGIN